MVLKRTLTRTNMPGRSLLFSRLHEEKREYRFYSYELLNHALIALPESDVFLRYRKSCLLAERRKLDSNGNRTQKYCSKKDPDNPRTSMHLATTHFSPEPLAWMKQFELHRIRLRESSNDPAIWQFRIGGSLWKGELEQSSYYFKKSLVNFYPDAEIAAHYGESLCNNATTRSNRYGSGLKKHRQVRHYYLIL